MYFICLNEQILWSFKQKTVTNRRNKRFSKGANPQKDRTQIVFSSGKSMDPIIKQLLVVQTRLLSCFKDEQIINNSQESNERKCIILYLVEVIFSVLCRSLFHSFHPLKNISILLQIMYRLYNPFQILLSSKTLLFYCIALFLSIHSFTH